MSFYKMAIADLENFTDGFPFGLQFPIPENKNFTEEKDEFTLIRLLYLLNRSHVFQNQGKPAESILLPAEKFFNEVQTYDLDHNLKQRMIQTGIVCSSDFNVLKSEFFLKDKDLIPLKKFDPGKASDIPPRSVSESEIDLLPYIPPKGVEEFRTHRRRKGDELQNIRKIAKAVEAKTESKEVIFIKEFRRDNAAAAKSEEEVSTEFSTPKGKELGAAKGEELSARKAKEFVIIKPFQGAELSAPKSEESCLSLLGYAGDDLSSDPPTMRTPRDDDEEEMDTSENDDLLLDSSISEDMHNTTSEELMDSRQGKELDSAKGKSSITADDEDEDKSVDDAGHLRSKQFLSLEAFLGEGLATTTTTSSSQSKLSDTPRSDDKSDTTHDEAKELITLKAFKGDDDDELGGFKSDEFVNLEGFVDDELGAFKSKECVNLDEFLDDDDDDNELENSSSQGRGDELDTTVKSDDEDMDVTIKAKDGGLDTIPEGDKEE